jgi:hypothetical protein
MGDSVIREFKVGGESDRSFSSTESDRRFRRSNVESSGGTLKGMMRSEVVTPDRKPLRFAGLPDFSRISAAFHDFSDTSLTTLAGGLSRR